jgi:hypothetical protein
VGQFALDADELGPLSLTVFFEPVGEDEPRVVVVRVLDYGLEKGVLIASHHPPLSAATGLSYGWTPDAPNATS